MRLSVVIPAYNEAHRIEATVRAVAGFLNAEVDAAELIVVDDGSTDATAERVRALRLPRVRLITLAENRGKGGALKAGIAATEGALVQLWDADLSYDLHDIHRAIARVEAGADMVLGARDLAPRDTRERYDPTRRVASWVFNQLVERALRLGVPDTQCGFKLIRGDLARELYPKLTLSGFSYDIELIAIARDWGVRIDRIPVEMTVAAGSTVRVTRDGPQMARDILKVRHNLHRKIYGHRPQQG